MKYFINNKEYEKAEFERILFFATTSHLNKNLTDLLKSYVGYDASEYIHVSLMTDLKNKHYDKVHKELLEKQEFTWEDVCFKIEETTVDKS